jgi:hypothetical protein
VISQSRLGAISAATAKEEPSRNSRWLTSARHSSVTSSMAAVVDGAKCRPTLEDPLRPSAMPISSTVTGRPSLRPRASAISVGAMPRGCWPRSQRATEVLS